MASRAALLLLLNVLLFTMISSSYAIKCPIDTLKLDVCAELLGRVNDGQVASQPILPCCSFINGLADLEATVCLCTAIKADILGTNLNVPLSLSVILNDCGRKAPPGFQCAE